MTMVPSKTKGEPELLRNILQRWLESQHLELEWKKYEAFHLWNQIADERLKKHTKPWRLVGNSLEILVDSAPYHFELRSFRKKELLEKLKRTKAKIEISDLCFICSRFSHP